MAKWRETLDERWEEWRLIEEAMARTLSGKSVLRVAGPRAPRLLPPASRAVRSGDLDDSLGVYDGGLACFCISELSPKDREAFLNAWHARLKDGATAVLADRRGAGCSTAFELHELFAEAGTQLDVQVGRTFWWVRYEFVKR